MDVLSIEVGPHTPFAASGASVSFSTTCGSHRRPFYSQDMRVNNPRQVTPTGVWVGLPSTRLIFCSPRRPERETAMTFLTQCCLLSPSEKSTAAKSFAAVPEGQSATFWKPPEQRGANGYFGRMRWLTMAKVSAHTALRREQQSENLNGRHPLHPSQTRKSY